MDDNNNSSDDEVQDGTLSPKLVNKKQKLNDGTSQDTIDETASATNKNENVDSGVCIDKNESTSSDGQVPSASNEVVISGPSTSNVRTFLLNIKRNYRKRRTPGQDSDSDSSKDSDDASMSSKDSDDVSMNGGATATSQQTDNSDDEPLEGAIFPLLSSDSAESIISEFHIGDTNSENSNDTFSDSMAQLHSGDTGDSDNDSISRDEYDDDDDENSNNRDKTKRPNVLLKERPKHSYVIHRELMKREMDLMFPLGRSGMSDVVFKQKFYGSLHAVYRLKRLHTLNKHRGCVNAINFHPEGNLLASGSDDMNVIVWDWARNKALQTIRTGHKSNVFQSKFLHLNARSQLNIVTCARDGQVRLVQCPPSGGAVESASRRRLCSHTRAAHKLHVWPAEPHAVLSAGEDGAVIHADVRHDKPDKLLTVKDRGAVIPLYSVHGHPTEPHYMVVAGRDRFVRVYDRRKSNAPAALYCPSVSSIFSDNINVSKKLLKVSMMHLTCAIYNHDGTEILGSYNDEDIFLFNTKADVYEKDSEKLGYTARFSGHRNSATFKGVAFFGPRSEYVVSGSDCSHIYVWDKSTESIVQWMYGDVGGVVNCIECHPSCPVLATSGLDKDVKIWLPSADADPTYKGMEKVIKNNSVSSMRSPLFNDFLPTLYSQWRSAERRSQGTAGAGAPLDSDGNACALV